MRFLEQNNQHPVELLLRVLGIASSTYYEWRKRARQPSDRHVEDEKLLAEIVDIHTSSGGTYGSPRVHAMLRRRGIRVGRKRVERLMRASQLQGAFLRKKWRLGSTRQDPRARPALDLVERNFTAEEPNRLWVADATRIPCGQGAFWLAAVRDAFSNRIVGWKTSDRCDTELVLGAMEYAVWSREIRDGQLIHHSDRGSTYTAIRFANRLADNGIAQSMGSVGDSYDNALIGELLLHPQDRVGLSAELAHPRRGRERPVRLHRRLVQLPAHPEEARLAITCRVRSPLPSTGSSRNQIIRSPD